MINKSLKNLGLAALVAFSAISADAAVWPFKSTNAKAKPVAEQINVSTNAVKGAEYGVSVFGSDKLKTRALEGVIIDGTPYRAIQNQLGKSASTNELPFELVKEDRDLTGTYDFAKGTYSQHFDHTHVPQLVFKPNSSNLYTRITLKSVSAKMPDFSPTRNVDLGAWKSEQGPVFGLKAVRVAGEDYFAPLDEKGDSRYLVPVKGAKAEILPDGKIGLVRSNGFYHLNRINYPRAIPAKPKMTNSLPSKVEPVYSTGQTEGLD